VGDREVLKDLERWYLAQCDGDWEHWHNIDIGTVDHPGWAVVIPLGETALEHVPYERFEAKRSEHDWLECSRDDENFQAICGPLSLVEVIQVFLEWALARRT
jgi:Immunity protein 53